jgi:hypothetical protein
LTSKTLLDAQSITLTNSNYPSKNNKRDELITNADGSLDLYFGPKPPAGKEANWTATARGKGWFRSFVCMVRSASERSFVGFT